MLSTKKLLYKVVDAIHTLQVKQPVLRTLTFNYTINANSTYNTNMKTLIDNDMPSGYTCVGIVGFASNNINAVTNNLGYYDSAYSFQIFNRTNSAISNASYRVYYLAIPA